MSTVTDTVRISLEVGCSEYCDAFSAPLYEQLSGGTYDVCSVLPMPQELDEWRTEHRTARKRADRAFRRRYYASGMERHLFAEDIYAINTSMAERQGRPMGAGYQARPSTIPDPTPTCWRHSVHPYGVFQFRRTLVGYLWLYRCGDLALVSSILGHGDHLESEIMYLLFEKMIELEIRLGGTIVYNRHDSGTDGLRFFKERLGFEARDVEWAL